MRNLLYLEHGVLLDVEHIVVTEGGRRARSNGADQVLSPQYNPRDNQYNPTDNG